MLYKFLVSFCVRPRYGDRMSNRLRTTRNCFRAIFFILVSAWSGGGGREMGEGNRNLFVRHGMGGQTWSFSMINISRYRPPRCDCHLLLGWVWLLENVEINKTNRFENSNGIYILIRNRNRDVFGSNCLSSRRFSNCRSLKSKRIVNSLTVPRLLYVISIRATCTKETWPSGSLLRCVFEIVPRVRFSFAPEAEIYNYHYVLT